MKRCIVIGKTNVGKTLFVLQFAAYLGADRLEITFEEPGGEKRTVTLSVDQAIRQLSSQEPHQTRCLQSIRLELPVGKGVKRFDVVDTSGLIEGIHGDVKVRKAMAQTLAAVRDADLILHLVDAAKAGERGRPSGGRRRRLPGGTVCPDAGRLRDLGQQDGPAQRRRRSRKDPPGVFRSRDHSRSPPSTAAGLKR